MTCASEASVWHVNILIHGAPLITRSQAMTLAQAIGVVQAFQDCAVSKSLAWVVRNGQRPKRMNNKARRKLSGLFPRKAPEHLVLLDEMLLWSENMRSLRHNRPLVRLDYMAFRNAIETARRARIAYETRGARRAAIRDSVLAILNKTL